MAARFVSGARKFDHISSILVKLRWLPISYRVVFKLLLLVFKALNGPGPRYSVELLQYQNHSKTLRSNSLELLLQQKSNTKTYGDRAFSTCAPRLWNNIPLDICKSNSVLLLKKLKTYLFGKFINNGLIHYYSLVFYIFLFLFYVFITIKLLFLLLL